MSKFHQIGMSGLNSVFGMPNLPRNPEINWPDTQAPPPPPAEPPAPEAVNDVPSKEAQDLVEPTPDPEDEQKMKRKEQSLVKRYQSGNGGTMLTDAATRRETIG